MPLAPDIDLAAAAADARTEVSLPPCSLLSYNTAARSIGLSAYHVLDFPVPWYVGSFLAGTDVLRVTTGLQRCRPGIVDARGCYVRSQRESCKGSCKWWPGDRQL